MGYRTHPAALSIYQVQVCTCSHLGVLEPVVLALLDSLLQDALGGEVERRGTVGMHTMGNNNMWLATPAGVQTYP